MNLYKITVITVCLNSEKTIRRTMDSVLQQGYQNYEYIIVDGGSRDKTIEYIEAYKEKFMNQLVLISEPDKGIYDAMNKGIRKAQGEFIVIINSDDYLEKQAFERIVVAIEAGNAEVICGNVIYIKKDHKRVLASTELFVDERQAIHKRLLHYAHPSTVIKKSVYEQYGLYEDRFFISSDYDLMIRLLQNKVNMTYIDHTLSYFTLGGVSQKQKIRGIREVRSINKKYFGTCYSSIMAIKAFVKFYVQKIFKVLRGWTIRVLLFLSCITVLLLFLVLNRSQNIESIIIPALIEEDTNNEVLQEPTIEVRNKVVVERDVGVFTLEAVNEGVLYLADKEYDLEDKTIRINKPIVISGPGKLVNGHIIIHDTSRVVLEQLETENVDITIANTTDVTIKNMTFNNIYQDILGFIVVGSKVSHLKIQNNTFSNIQYVSSQSTYGCGIKIMAHDTQLSTIEISENTFSKIHGPAAIWAGGDHATIDNLLISNNEIHDTESFGIEFFQVAEDFMIKNSSVKYNNIYDIGAIRNKGNGAGCGGIYSNLKGADIKVIGNTIRRVCEAGIEGYYTSIEENTIEDTGCDQLNYPIDDSAGIYTSSPLVSGNTIINPGYYGGIHFFTEGILTDMVIKDNVIKNMFEYWEEKKNYSIGDLVVSKEKWYVCTKEGISGNKPLADTVGGLKDGTCQWDYKKPLSDSAIRLNAIKGLERLEIRDNYVLDIKQFNALSGFVDHIAIYDNIHASNKLSKKSMVYLTGYGNRAIENENIETGGIVE